MSAASIEAIVERIAARVVDARLASVGPRWLRCSAAGVSHKQRRTLEPEGVRFAKIGKQWCYDASTLEAYVARQRAAEVPDDDDDPLADVDPEVARLVRAAVAKGAP
jgi:hypothetical protein